MVSPAIEYRAHAIARTDVAAVGGEDLRVREEVLLGARKRSHRDDRQCDDAEAESRAALVNLSPHEEADAPKQEEHRYQVGPDSERAS